MDFQLEVVAFNIASCLVAEAAGAHRIELCAGPGEGGTTPSYGLLKQSREEVSIPIYPIIRPRGGDFLYDEQEFDIMRADILACKKLGYEGVVIGLLNADGNIDKKGTTKLVELAYPMGVTFHRAFDRARDPMQALEDIIQCGCERILTSGQQPTAPEGAGLISQLVKQAGDRIIIMPGSGVRASNILQLIESTGAREFHTSARINIPSQMKFNNPSMKEELTSVKADREEIARILHLLKHHPA